MLEWKELKPRTLVTVKGDYQGQIYEMPLSGVVFGSIFHADERVFYLDFTTVDQAVTVVSEIIEVLNEHR